MSAISMSETQVALINTFKVDPAETDKLIAVLNEATEKVMRHRPGFVSANIHRSLDGSRVANYAQWRSKADFDAMLSDPACRGHMELAGKLAQSFDPVLYTVAAVHDA